MKKKIQNYINKWEKRCYKEGIPDEAPSRLEQLNKVPSYRQICIAIMKNDNSLKTLGFTQNKCNSCHILKRQELLEKVKIKESNQLKLNI
jgi:predicted phosphoadenosine phosphosulfate sulfurtransferase